CPCQAGPDLNHDLILLFPFNLARANSLPHRYTLESEDGTLSRERALARDARANEQQRAELTFEHLPEAHAYRLSCDDGTGSYTLFEASTLSDLQAQFGNRADMATAIEDT
ncbi:MAG TPA: hypothetical protein VFQ61_27645, partial [Polyangiaceae bacterium]|nr:hypothetical protein [Polyangiaceae bacterium]